MWGKGHLTTKEQQKLDNEKIVKELELLADAGVLNPEDLQPGVLQERAREG